MADQSALLSPDVDEPTTLAQVAPAHLMASPIMQSLYIANMAEAQRGHVRTIRQARVDLATARARKKAIGGRAKYFPGWAMRGTYAELQAYIVSLNNLIASCEQKIDRLSVRISRCAQKLQRDLTDGNGEALDAF